MAPNATATSAAAAFPSGLYGRYKHATEFFLNWLLHVRGAGVVSAADGHHASKKKEKKKKKKTKASKRGGVGLDVYGDIVAAIVNDPTALTPLLLHLWPHALDACETAITLRARVAQFFPSATEDDSHLHFLERLRTWLAVLQRAKATLVSFAAEPTVKGKAKDAESKKATEKGVDFTNYYAVLELPEDYFTVDADYAEPATTTPPIDSKSARAMSAAQRERLADEAFENDLNAEFSFLLMELEELLESVHNAWLDVKHQKRTLIEATAVTKVAVDSAASVIAALQARYPSIRTGYDMMAMIRDRIPTRQFDALWNKVLDNWSAFRGGNDDEKEYPKYVPGSIIVDLAWVSNALEGFVTTLPRAKYSHMQMVVLENDQCGDIYDEEEHPDQVWPSIHTLPPFFGRQLPVLYNILAMTRLKGVQADTTTLEWWFLAYLDEVVKSRKATLPCVFLFICWVRSVAVLQGDGGLCRTIGLSIMRRWDIEDRVRASIAHGAVLCAAPSVADLMARGLTHMEGVNMARTASVRANPLLAGLVLLDNTFILHELGSLSVLGLPRFRAFAHIYNAMVDRKLLDTIPFVEGILQVYERPLFRNSRKNSVHGSFAHSYEESCRVDGSINDAIVAVLERSQPTKRRLIGIAKDYEFSFVCQVYRVLKNKDFSQLPAPSWKTLLEAVSDLCKKELYQTRVLSRDILTLNDHISAAFSLLCDTFDHRHHTDPLEHSPMKALLQLMDCICGDGSLSVTEDALRVLLATEPAISIEKVTEAIQDYTRRAVAIVEQKFAHLTAEQVDAAYFFFPSSPEWATIEFGAMPFQTLTTENASEELFTAAMDLMERSDGPLQGEELQRLKDRVMLDPRLLGEGGYASTSELTTLLHHAVAGPAHDRRLLEWFVCMGALSQEMYIHRIESAKERLLEMEVDPNEIGNMLAVHSAAKAGLVDMVRHLLEAGHMRDLNTVTFHTRESLLHLAVKHSHRELYDELVLWGADLRNTDAEGHYVHSLTTDKVWKREIIEMSVRQQQQGDRKSGFATKHYPRLARDVVASAEQLRKSLAKQRDAERASRGRTVLWSKPVDSRVVTAGGVTIATTTTEPKTNA